MNDWNIKKFLMVILSIQFAIWGLIGLDSINIHIPILRQLICFLYLTFVPGMLILRILKQHDLGNIETTVYAVGLSIASLMFIGFFINYLYPVIGFLKPISMKYLIVTISVLVLFLSFIAYLRDRDFSSNVSIDSGYLTNPTVLFFCILPFLTVFATYIFNLNGSNILQMFILFIIALVPLLMLKFGSKEFYPFVIFITSLCLLLHTSLISNYIWGADIQHELYLSNFVLTNSYWNMSIQDNCNAMLSLVVLAPIMAIMLKMKVIWIFKIIYPMIFALVPVGLYKVFYKQTNTEIAFLASFFFISMHIFYTIMPALARQEIAELFFVLIILLILNKEIKPINRAILLLIFGSSMVVSHYGITYIFIFLIILAGLISYILDKLNNEKSIYKVINKNYAVLFIVFTLVWFMYVSDSSIFNIGVNIGNNILSSMTDMLDPSKSQSLVIISGTLPLLQSIERYFHLCAQFFIMIGIFFLLRNKFENINKEYKSFSIASFLMLGACIVVPNFASTLNTDRIYHITLFFLAPFFVLGFICSTQFLMNLIGRKFNKKQMKRALYLIALFLLVFSLLSSAFLYEITNQDKTGKFAVDKNADFYWVNNPELYSINWLNEYNDPKYRIYGDFYKSAIILSIIGQGETLSFQNFNNTRTLQRSYIFLSDFNIKNDKLFIIEKSNKISYFRNPNLMRNMSKIQDSGSGWILYQ
ncbi:DUF2206 domain-containing protein [Methanobacterium congolense]|nr:DUF2206 domain-containing protein [Methanobacterium congolense]